MAKYYFDLEDMGLFNFKAKNRAMMTYVRYMLDRTQAMFKYTGLPETIPARELELLMQCFGYAGFAEVDGMLYAFRGGLGGEPDVYYRPTIFTVANPALNFTANLKIDKECVIIKNDSMLYGLTPMFRRYSSQLVETDITMRLAVINKRAQKLIAAADDGTKTTAEIFLNKLEAGELGVVGNNAFLESLKTYDYDITSNQSLTELIEMRNYHLASWYQDIGINANANMKREAINDAEAQLNDRSLLPLIDDMLNCRKEGLEMVNKMFGTEITVDLASSWKDEARQIEATISQIEHDPEEKEVEE